MFGLLKDLDISPSLFGCYGCDITISNEIVKFDALCLSDPQKINYKSTRGQDLDCAKMDFSARLPPCIAKDKPSAVNEDSLSNYCKFAPVLMSLPPFG